MSTWEWYGRWFNDWYLKVYSHRDGAEAKAFVDLSLKFLKLSPGSRILDLCCGAGRHTEHFRLRGFSTVGLDLSMTLLRRSLAENPSLTLVRGDMAELPFKPVFDAVVNLFTSFGYFDKDEENQAVFIQVRNSLKSGGRFLFDLANSDYTLSHLIPVDKKKCDGWEVVQKRRYNTKSRRIEKEISIACPHEMHRYKESVRLYTPQEIVKMVRASGLVHRKTVDGKGRPLSAQSDRMILVGEAP